MDKVNFLSNNFQGRRNVSNIKEPHLIFLLLLNKNNPDKLFFLVEIDYPNFIPHAQNSFSQMTLDLFKNILAFFSRADLIELAIFLISGGLQVVIMLVLAVIHRFWCGQWGFFPTIAVLFTIVKIPARVKRIVMSSF